MTRSTQRNKIIRVASISSIRVCPLSLWIITPLTFWRYIFNASKPVMKTSISDLISFPCIVFFACWHVTIGRRLMAWSESCLFPNFKNLFSSPFSAGYKRAVSTTIMVFLPIIPRWQGLESCITVFTFNNHTNIIGETQ